MFYFQPPQIQVGTLYGSVSRSNGSYLALVLQARPAATKGELCEKFIRNFNEY